MKNPTSAEETVDQQCLIWSRFLKNNTLGIFYSGALDTFTFKVITDELNNYEPNSIKKFVLFWESPGGNASLVKCFRPIMKSLGMCAIVGFSQTSSAAFQIMLECKNHNMPVYIDPMCNVLVHRCSCATILEQRSERIMEYNEKWVKTTEKIIDEMNQNIFDDIDTRLKKKYDSGLNVYLLGDDLIKVGIFKEYKEGIF